MLRHPLTSIAFLAGSTVMAFGPLVAGEPREGSMVVVGVGEARAAAIDGYTAIEADDLATAFERHYGLEVTEIIESTWKEVPTIHSLSFNDAIQ